MRLACCLVMTVLAAAANDTLATLGAGGLVPLQSSQIAMEREELEISVHQINVRYRFRNNSDRDVNATVAFPLPDLEGGTVEHVPLQLPSKSSVNFMGFEVLAAGKPVAVQMDVRAVHEGSDITGRLRAAGLPVSVADEHFAEAVRKLTEAQHKQLVKEQILVSDDGGARYWPYWTTKIQFYWTQHFPARSSIEIQHKYRPVVGGSYITRDDNGSSHIKPYCGGADALVEIQAVKKRHPARNEDAPVLLERRIQYILTTANNWSGPIHDFRLTVVADTPDDIVFTCTRGLQRVAPTRYQLARTGFHPDHNLDLLILQPAK